MPVSICPRCKHVNPEYAIYCHFDGVVLQAQQHATAQRLPLEFTFPSGRRCKTMDELGQAFQEEWMAARDLLMRGLFAQFFQNCKRDDLVRAANDARALGNPDIALTTFLGSLPGVRTATPKVDLNPRRILLGIVPVGETKTVPLTITNQGQGLLQGTITVTEGQDWLSLSETSQVHQLDVNTMRSQTIKLTINTKGVAAGQTYGAKLTVVTNGGVVEVPLRMDLAAQPFTRAPFQGVRTQRELAEAMRDKSKTQRKEVLAILESGEVQRWFTLNGWTYPVVGTPVKGIAGVQQFFEGMGVSKPPPVQLSQAEFRFMCMYRDTLRGQVSLQTPAKKWVYAQASSDSSWLKFPQPQVSGPQRATLPFEIDTSRWSHGLFGEAKATIEANGGQKLTLKVIVEVQGAPAIQATRPPAAVNAPPTVVPVPTPLAPGPPPVRLAPSAEPLPVPVPVASPVKFLPAFLTTVMVLMSLRVLFIPFIDVMSRSSCSDLAAKRLGIKDAHLAQAGDWLQLPWVSILTGANADVPAKYFDAGNESDLRARDFRHYFASYFLFRFVLGTFWVGAIAGAIMVARRGSVMDLPWGIVAGTFAGLAASATYGAFFLSVEMLPHALWQVTIGRVGGPGYLVLWIVFSLLCWLFVAVFLGAVMPWIAPLRRMLIDPWQRLLAWIFAKIGMNDLSARWEPS